MKKEFLNYPDWQDTADTLHMYLQIIGKVKLERCFKRPEWAQVRLYLTIDGLTTGIIPGDRVPFEILFDLHKHRVEVRSADGKDIVIPLVNDLSVAEFYREMLKALEYVGSPTQINVRSQEFYDPVDFDKDEKHHSYDSIAARLFLDNLHFAYHAMTEFMSPFRGKVDFPAYYFGTMDLSGIVFSGESAPFSRKGVISEPAFDERCCEFGFWPGDPRMGQPSFYVMPYPFIENIGEYSDMLEPDGAIFLPEKKEFFFTLENAFSYEDSSLAVRQFFRNSFDIVQKLAPWKQLDWIMKPLDYQV